MGLESRPSFCFSIEGPSLVDRVNGLRISGHQWPEYCFTVSVEPRLGEQSEAWPLSARAYFEFAYTYSPEQEPKTCTFSMAVAHQPFERDFPGRTEELLDAVLPLIIPTSLTSFPQKDLSWEAKIPDQMRPLLLTGGSYYRHRDEPGTDEYRQANPGAGLGPVGKLARVLRKILS